MHEAANNWGIALAAEAQALAGQDQAEARRLWARAGEQYARALSIKADMHEAANNWGSALAADAQALVDHDLAEARRLWAKADEQFTHALSIKADLHKVANNLVTMLTRRSNAVRSIDPSGARSDVERAVELLERHGRSSESSRVAVAYNLACAYALSERFDDAIRLLDVCRNAGGLPAHWQEDDDLAALRDTESYRAWLGAHLVG